MAEIIVLLLMFLAKAMTDDDTELEAMQDGMLEDGEYDWADVGGAFGALTGTFIEEAPELATDVAQITALQEAGALTSIGIDPSGNGSAWATAAKFLPWVLLAAGGVLVYKTITDD